MIKFLLVKGNLLSSITESVGSNKRTMYVMEKTRKNSKMSSSTKGKFTGMGGGGGEGGGCLEVTKCNNVKT